MNAENQSRFLTLNEAAANANVGQETILKYKDLGLLQTFRINGQEQFREDEIRLVFNSRKKTTHNQSANNSDIEKNELGKSANNTSFKSKNTNSSNEKEEELPTLNDILSERIEIETSPDSQKRTPKDIENKIWRDNQSNSDLHQNEIDSENPQHFDIPSIELLELTRSLKDQLETIREERNWLRRRVEKLESTIEREQMITISKDETLRNLIEQNRPMRKPWAFLLPWNK